MKELRANTAVIVPIGPVVSIADGFTPVTTLDISTADSAQLLKHNTSTSVDISARTWSFITAMRNTYALSLTTTDTNAEGCIEVVITDDSLNLTVVKEFMVLSQAAYDSKYQEKDSGYMTVDVPGLSTGSSAISAKCKPSPDGFVITTGSNEVNTEDSTFSLDGVAHSIEDSAGTTDCYYEFNVGGNGVPTSVSWEGYAQGKGDEYQVFAYNWGDTAWEQVATITADNGTTLMTETFTLTRDNVGVGANVGDVRLRFYSTDGALVATDRILCDYSVVAQSVGYADGAVWIDTVSGTAGSELYVNGTADNPVSTWTDAKSILSGLGLSRVSVISDSVITLDSAMAGHTMFGSDWTLNLGNQSITGARFKGAAVSGIASTGGAYFQDCNVGAITCGPSTFDRCEMGVSGGDFTGTGAGGFVFLECGRVSGTALGFDFDFTGVTGPSTINARGWFGSSNFLLNANCDLRHHIVAGGTTEVTTGGGNVAIRGNSQTIDVTMSAAETVNFVGVAGPITLQGTTTGTVNLYGVAASVTDGTSGATIANETVSQTTINVEALAAITAYDGPTNAEMEARTLLAADYFDPAADTVANVTLVDTTTDVTNGVSLAAGAITDASLAGNMEIVFETDFATNYSIARDAWVTNTQDTTGTGNLPADVIAISGDTTAADNAELAFDGTGYGFTNCVIPSVTLTATTTDVTNGVTLAAGAVTNASLAGNMEIVFETDFATNYSTARDAWVTNVQDTVGTGTLGLNDLSAADILTTALTESYAADGAAPTLTQAIMAIQQFLQEKSVTGTVLSVRELDGSTVAMSFTLDDDTSPTSITRAV